MYEIKRTSIKGDYSLIADDQEIFVFKHGSWLKGVADVYYHDEHIQVRKKHALSGSHVITRNGIEAGRITFDWKMAATIQLFDEQGAERIFTFKKKGTFKAEYKLVDAETKLHVLTLSFDMKWKKLNYEYDVKLINADEVGYDIPELLIYSMYALKRYQAMAAGA